jgi:hypothetical protein
MCVIKKPRYRGGQGPEWAVLPLGGGGSVVASCEISDNLLNVISSKSLHPTYGPIVQFYFPCR